MALWSPQIVPEFGWTKLAPCPRIAMIFPTDSLQDYLNPNLLNCKKDQHNEVNDEQRKITGRRYRMRFGIISWIRLRHASEFELVAVCDLKPDVLDTFFERSKITRGSVHEYNDYRAMLEKENLDVVSVATPDDYHTNPVCDASDAGVKGILCEKPLTINLNDADRIIETVERNGTKMSVDHTRSWAAAISRGANRGPRR